MSEKQPSEASLTELSKKLNVLISLSLRQLTDDKQFSRAQKRKQGAGDYVRYLADMGLEAKDIAEIIGAPLPSVRTLMTPSRRK